MELTLDNISNYLKAFVRHPHPILADLEADAAARRVPIVGPREAQQLLNACLQRLRPGGLLLCDNALRGGNVLDETTDAGALATKAFTASLLQNPDLDATLIPLRDGLLVCRQRDA